MTYVYFLSTKKNYVVIDLLSNDIKAVRLIFKMKNIKHVYSKRETLKTKSARQELQFLINFPEKKRG